MTHKQYGYLRRTTGPSRSMDGVMPRSPAYARRPVAVRTRSSLTSPSAPSASTASSASRPASQYKPAATALTPTAKRRQWKPLVGVGTLVLFAGFLLYGHLASGGSLARFSTIEHAAAETRSLLNGSNKTAAVLPNTQIVNDMNAVINAQSGLQASATVVDLNSGQTYNAGASSSMFTTASTGKLITVFDYMHQVELGNASLTQSIGGDTAQDIIERMIVYSDNNAWAALNSYLTLPQEQSYMNSLGITSTVQPENWQITSGGMARLLQLLYTGKLMNASHQALIYNYMSHTTVTNLIQAALPSGATVYHKYGQIEGVLHDASIIEYQGHDFVLVVYTNNPDGTTDMYSSQVDLIHAVAQAAFGDMTSN